MRKCFAGALLVFLLGFWGTALAGSELVIGVEDKDWPGHYTWEQQELVGIDADVVRSVAQRLGYEVRFVPYPWKRVLQMAQEKQIDGVLDLAPVTNRLEYLYYIETPVSLASTVLWKKKDSLYSFDGTFQSYTRLGLLRGTDWSDRFAREGQPQVVRFDSYKAAFINLLAKRIDTFGGYLRPTQEHMKRLGFLHKFEVAQIIDQGLSYYLALTHKPQYEALSKEFSQALAVFYGSREYTALLKKYGAPRMKKPFTKPF